MNSLIHLIYDKIGKLINYMPEAIDALISNYFTDLTYDEMLSPEMEVKPNWRTLLSNITAIGTKELKVRQNDLNWYLAENGVTYNVYNDPQGLNRPWQLNVVPSIIDEISWETIEKGIKQRAELLNLIIQDLYGKRELISKGIIPQDIIFNHRGFLRQCDQVTYNTTKHLLIYAADLARSPDGRMWVLNDRTQAPSGMGYALENRITLGRVLPDLFKDTNVKKLYTFFSYFNELLVESCPRKKENPNIVILTPGPHNETYFEHAYLASFLGYSLVQGNDLVVREGHLWMKSLKGLKLVDVVLRRVDDIFTDPLELKEDSHLGVPGLLDVVHRQNVTIINPIGTRILENPGLMPFMNNIAKHFLNEELILPQIASWWCGQEKEKKYVLDNLNKLIVTKIDRSQNESIFIGNELKKTDLETLRKKIIERPSQFVAQENINFSTTPTFEKNNFEPRNMVLRTFAISNKKNYYVMPGGLVRVAPSRGNIMVSNQRGGTSKDMWVTCSEKDIPNKVSSLNRNSAISASGLDDLPSLTAEKLFWAGRYVGRTLSTARFLRMVLKQMSFVQRKERKPNSSNMQLLFKAVTQITSTFPGFTEDDKLEDPYKEMLSVILDPNRSGSLSYTLSMFSSAYYSIRNLWSTDMWRVFDRIETIWRNLQTDKNLTPRKIIQTLDQLITRLIAFMGLIEESILIDQGLLMYFIGLQIEQSSFNISKSRALLSIKHDEQIEYELLESLLNSHESLNIYRYSYRSHITIENVIHLILLDLKYPRSLVYKLNRLNKDLGELPHSKKSHELTDYEKFAFEAFSKLRLVEASELMATEKENVKRETLDKLLEELSDLLYKTSMAITNTYFSHTYKQNQLVTQKLPV